MAMTSPVAFICVPNVTTSFDKFIKRPFRDFGNDVVDSRLKAGFGGASDLIRDLIEGITNCNARGDLGNRIPSSLRSQSRAARQAVIWACIVALCALTMILLMEAA